MCAYLRCLDGQEKTILQLLQQKVLSYAVTREVGTIHPNLPAVTSPSSDREQKALHLNLLAIYYGQDEQCRSIDQIIEHSICYGVKLLLALQNLLISVSTMLFVL